MSELKPCPFCGGEVYVAKIEPRLYRPSCNHPCSVVCYNCDLYFGYDEDYGGEFDTEAEAIEAWNRRFVTDTNVGSKVAKVINQEQISRYKFGSCGACGAPVVKPDKYCSECGEKLDWSE